MHRGIFILGNGEQGLGDHVFEQRLWHGKAIFIVNGRMSGYSSAEVPKMVNSASPPLMMVRNLSSVSTKISSAGILRRISPKILR